MPSTKSQKVAKAVNTEDDTQKFVEKQKDMYRAVSETARSSSHVSDVDACVVHHQSPLRLTTGTLKIKNRRDEARSRIRKNRSNREKDLQARIKARSRPGNNTDVPSFDHTAFEALRDLLIHKADIERRIAQSIETLEKAINTAFHEFQVVLRSQAEIFKTTTTPANTSAAAESSKALIVKQ